jgi:WD40 repeat protein
VRSAVVAVAVVLALAGCSGSHHSAGETRVAPRDNAPTTTQPQERKHTQAPESRARMALGLPAIKSGPVPGYVLIADRDNGRILLVSPDKKRAVWRYTGLQDPDDAFFTPDYRGISTNEEYDQTIKLLSLKKHALVWSYGHPGVRGSSPGYLSNPDDAYVLQNGLVMVADIQNCRVLIINGHHRIVREIGHAGNCTHNPPATISSPNGATPLPDGGVLVTEIGGWVDRIGRGGRLLYTVPTPTSYPSDAQLLPDGNVLVAGFDSPGRVDEITPSGRVVWTFAPTGYWSLDRPSLAVRWPNGMIAITDDWHHRVLAVDKRTKKVVWSYGHLNQPGTAPGYLNKPDGLDLLPVPVAKEPVAASAPAAVGLVTRIGTLPQPLSKAVAVAFPNGELLVLGGLVNGSSTDQILAGAPSSLRAAGSLPAPTHDAAAAVVDGKALLFGGGESVSTSTIVAVSPDGAARRAGALDEPLSDLGSVRLDGRTYLVGGYTGSQYASAVLGYENGKTVTVARLREGTRYAGVAGLDGRIYVAGGLTLGGPTDAVWSVRPGGTPRKVATLPRPEAHGALAAFGGALYYVGGTRILRILVSGEVSTVARLPHRVEDPGVVTVGDEIVIVGGGTSSVYAYKP